MRINLRLILSGLLLSLVTGCNETNSADEKASSLIAGKKKARSTTKKIPLSEQFKSYWYNGQAEISSFELFQERYGEIREGTAVLVYVTEDFLPDVQVKANNYNSSNTSVLKLNKTKKFVTGIYPYSIMESSFYPVGQQSHALKVSTSVQEWCGQVYAQLNNREQFDIISHSYFQGEGDQQFKLEKAHLENEIWNIIRIDPFKLPQGKIEMIPSLEYCRLRHKDIKSYAVIATLDEGRYTLSYPDLERKLEIQFNTEFPYEILEWEETTAVGYGATKSMMSSKAKRLESMRSAYWSKNRNTDRYLRGELKLDQPLEK